MYEAVKTIIKNIRRMEDVKLPLRDCLGLVAYENVHADGDLPASAISGRDGYAVRSQDIQGAMRTNPVRLRVMGSVRAGRTVKYVLTSGMAIRIMTGAVIPEGADCVVQFEDTDEPEDKGGHNKMNPLEVQIYKASLPGGNIWAAGSSVRKGEIILPEGTSVGPAQISVLASIGKTKAGVIRRPKVAIIDTGDELVRPGGRLSSGKIYSGGGEAVAALVKHYGGVPNIVGIARDNEISLTSKIQKATKEADAIVTIGGASNGDYDLVRFVVAKIGKIIFSGVRMMPGIGAAFGVIKRPGADGGAAADIPIFSLAGPPAGCMVNFETLVRPALLKMLGYSDVLHPSVEAEALDAVRNTKPVALAMFTCLKVTGGGYQVRFKITDGVGMRSSMTAANSLTILPRGAVVETGDKIQVMPLDWRRDQRFV